MDQGLDELKKHSKHFFFASFIIIALISIYMIRNYITTVVGSIVLAYAFYPLFKKLSIRIHNRTLSALIISILVIALITIPLLFAANKIINESVQLFHQAGGLEFKEFSNLMKSYFGENIDFDFYIKEIVNKFSISIAQSASDFVISIPKKAINAFIIVFLMFYLFLDGKKLVELLKKELPLKDMYKKEIFEKFDDTIYAVIYGVVVTALVQGTIGAIGLWIFDIPSPLVWGLVMTILAMLPFVGAFLIWLPAAIIKISVGDTFNGVGLLLYGLFIVSTIDNIIKPKIIGHRSRIHPTLVLLGVVGGIKVFGLFGIVVGPLLLAILTVFLDIYISEKNEPVI